MKYAEFKSAGTEAKESADTVATILRIVRVVSCIMLLISFPICMHYYGYVYIENGVARRTFTVILEITFIVRAAIDCYTIRAEYMKLYVIGQIADDVNSILKEM